MEDNIRILYAQFAKRAGMFVRVVEQLDRSGGGKRAFDDLLIKLDGSYYDR